MYKVYKRLLKYHYSTENENNLDDPGSNPNISIGKRDFFLMNFLSISFEMKKNCSNKILL